MRVGARGFSPAALVIARQQQGLSRSDLAIVMDIHPSTIASWENGDRTPSPAHLQAAARTLNLKVDDLLTIARADANLASLRERAGLTASAVARHLGVSKGTWSATETATRRLNQDEVRLLAELLDTPEPEVQAAWNRTRDRRTRRINER